MQASVMNNTSEEVGVYSSPDNWGQINKDIEFNTFLQTSPSTHTYSPLPQNNFDLMKMEGDFYQYNLQLMDSMELENLELNNNLMMLNQDIGFVPTMSPTYQTPDLMTNEIMQSLSGWNHPFTNYVPEPEPQFFQYCPSSTNSALFAPYGAEISRPFPSLNYYSPPDDILNMSFDFNNSKPSYSYSQLITRALLETPSQQLLLSEIYDWILNRFPFFQSEKTGVWKNSVRHNLSVNKSFRRAPRLGTQPGKGSYWTLDIPYLLKSDKRHQRRKF